MREAYALIDAQPESWPRWANGVVHVEAGPALSDHIHMFLLEPVPGVPYPRAGNPVPACRFAGGARYVEIDKTNRPLVEYLCDECCDVIAGHRVHTKGEAVLDFP